MSRKLNIVNNVISFLITVVSLFLIVVVANNRYPDAEQMTVIGLMFLGVVISGLLCTFLHELGHLIFGKANNFTLISFKVWFFVWTKRNGKTEFNFTLPLEEAGCTEMVAKSDENLEKNYRKMTFGGLFLTFIAMLIGLVPLFLPKLSLTIFCLWSTLIPIGAYVFFGNALPMEGEGIKNDGAILKSLRLNDDNAKVVINLLKIQSHLFNGKSPAEIDESLYFDLPQLPEDNYNFLILLNARYYYYLDAGRYDEAIKTQNRAESVLQYVPKSCSYPIKVDSLYNACVLNKDEELADDLMYELEKFLNATNSATSIRVKMAYIAFITGETEKLELFYKKGLKEVKRGQIKGLVKLENKLIEEIYSQFK